MQDPYGTAGGRSSAARRRLRIAWRACAGRFAACLLAGYALLGVGASAYAAASRDDAQLEVLLAPVALFDDRLLLDTLDASRHPLQVLQARSQLRDGRPIAAAQAGLAPGVRELAHVPYVLDMLAEHPGWSRQLGEAFVGQQADVLRAVQRLRRRAWDAGTLTQAPGHVVQWLGDMISIHAAPPPPLPLYDPWCVYGPWSAAQRAFPLYEPAPAVCDAPSRRVVLLPAGAAPLADDAPWAGIDWSDHGVWVDPQLWHRWMPHQPAPPWWRPRPRQAPRQPLRPPPAAAPAPPGLPGKAMPTYPLHVPREQPGFGYPPLFAPPRPHAPAPGTQRDRDPAPGQRQTRPQPLPRGPQVRMPAPRGAASAVPVPVPRR